MSHQRAEKKYPVDKYSKEKNGSALFYFKWTQLQAIKKKMVCEKWRNSLNILFTF